MKIKFDVEAYLSITGALVESQAKPAHKPLISGFPAPLGIVH